MNKDIFELPLHEEMLILGNITALSVPGGWIYNVYDDDNNNVRTSTFVPMIENHDLKNI